MKIINKTNWDTKQLRALFARCTNEVRRREGNRWELKNQSISVKYQRGINRQKWIGGCAYYNSRTITMKIPRETFPWTSVGDKHDLNFSQCIADTFIHEIGHNLGVKHCKGSTCEQHYREWIVANVSNEKFPIGKKIAPLPKTKNIQEKRYSSSISNLAKAETRLKRAKTIFQKWNRKVKYYESKLTMVTKNN